MTSFECDDSGDEADQRWMARAIDLARNGEGRVEPNPMVGCVLVREDRVIGEGWHQQFGGPHAEVHALADCTDARGATAYVSLEPCSHFGKTPPCAAALIGAGVRRVVVAMEDPFPEVSGRGVAQLRAAGIDVCCGVARRDAEQVVAPYLTRIGKKRPWVIAKWAMTLDGRIATRSGQSQWITGDQARADVHRHRSRVDAIAVGMGTVIADDPELTARGVPADSRPGSESPAPPVRTPVRLVYSLNRLPAVSSRLIRTLHLAPVQIFTGARVSGERKADLIAAGAVVHTLPTDDPADLVDLSMRPLYDAGVTNLIVEGGGELIASFRQADLIDECHVYIGGKIVGGQAAPGPVGGLGVAELTDSLCLECRSVERFGPDVKLTYRVTGEKILGPLRSNHKSDADG